MSTNYLSLKMLEVCLNPYYNGKYSMSKIRSNRKKEI